MAVGLVIVALLTHHWYIDMPQIIKMGKIKYRLVNRHTCWHCDTEIEFDSSEINVLCVIPDTQQLAMGIPCPLCHNVIIPTDSPRMVTVK